MTGTFYLISYSNLDTCTGSVLLYGQTCFIQTKLIIKFNKRTGNEGNKSTMTICHPLKKCLLNIAEQSKREI